MVWTELRPAVKRNQIKRRASKLSFWFWWPIFRGFDINNLQNMKLIPPRASKDINTGPIVLNTLLDGV